VKTITQLHALDELLRRGEARRAAAWRRRHRWTRARHRVVELGLHLLALALGAALAGGAVCLHHLLRGF